MLSTALKARIRSAVRSVVHRGALLPLRLFAFKTRREIGDRPCVAILADYAFFSEILSVPALAKTHRIVLIASARHPFAAFRAQGAKLITHVEIVDGFGTQSRPQVLKTVSRHNPDAVLIQSGEFLVPMANYLNRELGLRGNSELASEVSLSKQVMRERLAAAGANTIQFAACESADEVKGIDFWPAVVKANVSTGGFGVSLATSSDEFERAHTEASLGATKTEFEQSFIVEEYVHGRQYDIEGLILGGQPVIYAIVEEYYEERLPSFDHGWFLANSRPSPGLLQQFEHAVAGALASAEFVHGAFHCELRVDQSGTVRILEFSNRMGGGFERFILHATGRNIVDDYVNSMLGRQVDVQENKDLYVLHKYCYSEDEIEHWSESARSKEIDVSVDRRTLRSFVGMVTAETLDWDAMAALRSELPSADSRTAI